MRVRVQTFALQRHRFPTVGKVSLVLIHRKDYSTFGLAHGGYHTLSFCLSVNDNYFISHKRQGVPALCQCEIKTKGSFILDVIVLICSHL